MLTDRLTRAGPFGHARFSSILKWSGLPGLAAVCLLLLIYAGTLQRDVNGSSSDYMIDVGEIQIALNVWGTIHFTGYPLYTILSSLLTSAGRTAGIPPAAAASVTSSVWSVSALAITYCALMRLTGGKKGISALMILTLGLVETFWIHSVVAEVYSFSFLLMSATVLIALRLAERWNKADWLALMALQGVALAHHRQLIFFLPVAVFPIIRNLKRHFPRRLSWVLYSSLALLFPFLAYLYLPLRAAQGAFWVYGDPDTWSGFWDQFLGREAARFVLVAPAKNQHWLSNLRVFSDNMARQLPPIILLVGGIGLIWLARRHLWLGTGFLVSTLGLASFSLLFPNALWPPVAQIPLIYLSALGLSHFVSRLSESWPFVRWAALFGLLALCLMLFTGNLPFVLKLVRDPSGREIVRTLEPLEQSKIPGGRNVVALPWGGSYFAAVYGKNVTKELEGFELVDHRADFRSIVEEQGKILTMAFNLGQWPLNWWTDLLGTAYYSSAVPNVAVISQEKLYQSITPQESFELGNGVIVRAVTMKWVDEGRLWVTVYWEKGEVMKSDYRVALHLVSKDPPVGPDDVVAQADAINPVSGWYPVTLWELGEVVRDDYWLNMTPGPSPNFVRIGMYQIADDGTFQNSEWLSLKLPP